MQYMVSNLKPFYRLKLMYLNKIFKVNIFYSTYFMCFKFEIKMFNISKLLNLQMIILTNTKSKHFSDLRIFIVFQTFL